MNTHTDALLQAAAQALPIDVLRIIASKVTKPIPLKPKKRQRKMVVLEELERRVFTSRKSYNVQQKKTTKKRYEDLYDRITCLVNESEKEGCMELYVKMIDKKPDFQKINTKIVDIVRHAYLFMHPRCRV